MELSKCAHLIPKVWEDPSGSGSVLSMLENVLLCVSLDQWTGHYQHRKEAEQTKKRTQAPTKDHTTEPPAAGGSDFHVDPLEGGDVGLMDGGEDEGGLHEDEGLSEFRDVAFVIRLAGMLSRPATMRPLRDSLKCHKGKKTRPGFDPVPAHLRAPLYCTCANAAKASNLDSRLPWGLVTCHFPMQGTSDTTNPHETYVRENTILLYDPDSIAMAAGYVGNMAVILQTWRSGRVSPHGLTEARTSVDRPGAIVHRFLYGALQGGLAGCQSHVVAWVFAQGFLISSIGDKKMHPFSGVPADVLSSTPLGLAVESGNSLFLKWCLEAGADPEKMPLKTLRVCFLTQDHSAARALLAGTGMPSRVEPKLLAQMLQSPEHGAWISIVLQYGRQFNLHNPEHKAEAVKEVKALWCLAVNSLDVTRCRAVYDGILKHLQPTEEQQDSLFAHDDWTNLVTKIEKRPDLGLGFLKKIGKSHACPPDHDGILSLETLDIDGDTMLYVALTRGHLGLVKMLTEDLRVDPMTRRRNNINPYSDNNRKRHGDTALHGAVQKVFSPGTRPKEIGTLCEIITHLLNRSLTPERSSALISAGDGDGRSPLFRYLYAMWDKKPSLFDLCGNGPNELEPPVLELMKDLYRGELAYQEESLKSELQRESTRRNIFRMASAAHSNFFLWLAQEQEPDLGEQMAHVLASTSAVYDTPGIPVKFLASTPLEFAPELLEMWHNSLALADGALKPTKNPDFVTAVDLVTSKVIAALAGLVSPTRSSYDRFGRSVATYQDGNFGASHRRLIRNALLTGLVDLNARYAKGQPSNLATMLMIHNGKTKCLIDKTTFIDYFFTRGNLEVSRKYGVAPMSHDIAAGEIDEMNYESFFLLVANRRLIGVSGYTQADLLTIMMDQLGCDPLKTVDSRTGDTVLHVLASTPGVSILSPNTQGFLTASVKAVVERGAKWNVPNKAGKTPLHCIRSLVVQDLYNSVSRIEFESYFLPPFAGSNGSSPLLSWLFSVSSEADLVKMLRFVHEKCGDLAFCFEVAADFVPPKGGRVTQSGYGSSLYRPEAPQGDATTLLHVWLLYCAKAFSAGDGFSAYSSSYWILSLLTQCGVRLFAPTRHTQRSAKDLAHPKDEQCQLHLSRMVERTGVAPWEKGKDQ